MAQHIEKVSEIETRLRGEGIDVLIDDRDMGAGAKFADADLIGCPLRLVVSEKTLKENSVEWKERVGGDARLAPLDGLTAEIAAWMKA